MIALSVAKLKMFSPESEICLWIKPKKKKKNFFFVESLGQRRRLEVREKARNVFRDDPTSVWSNWSLTQHRNFMKFFFYFAGIFSLSSLVFRTSKFLEFKEFNKTIIPFAPVGYMTGYSQLGTMRLVGITKERPFGGFHLATTLWNHPSKAIGLTQCLLSYLHLVYVQP